MRPSPLGANPGYPTLGLDCHSMRVALAVDGTAPVVRGHTARVLESTTHAARERDRDAAITGAVICRRVAGQPPDKCARHNDTTDDADHYQRGAPFARRERVPWRRLTVVDRRRLLRPAKSIGPQYMHPAGLRMPCEHWSATHPSNLKLLCRIQYFQKAFMGWAYMSLSVSGARVPGVGLKASSRVAIRLYSL
jgi:hypothetical protein